MANGGNAWIVPKDISFVHLILFHTQYSEVFVVTHPQIGLLIKLRLWFSCSRAHPQRHSVNFYISIRTHMRILRAFWIQWLRDVLGHSYALQGYTGPGTTWAYGMNFGIKHAQGAGSIARLVDLQSNVVPLCYGCSLLCIQFASYQLPSIVISYP